MYTAILNAVTNNDAFPSWYTHVRASYGIWCDRDHLRRYRRSRFKKGRWPAFVHVASFKTRSLSQSSAVSHFTIVSATRAAECYVSKAAGHVVVLSSWEYVSVHFLYLDSGFAFSQLSQPKRYNITLQSDIKISFWTHRLILFYIAIL